MIDQSIELLSANPLVPTFSLICLGVALGRIKVRGVALGPAAVLFAAIAVSAFAKGRGMTIEVPQMIGTLGLMLFTFAIGEASGQTFFKSVRTEWRIILTVIMTLGSVATLGLLLGLILGLDTPTIAGTFAGALNNTPGLGAAIEASGSTSPTVGYSVAYLFGALGPLVLITRALRRRSADTDAPSPVITRPIRIERTDGFGTLGDVVEWYGEQITFSRMRREEDGPVETAMFDDRLEVGDVIVIDGPADLVDQVTTQLGHASTHHIERENKQLSMRRITISNPELAGIALGDLHLDEKFNASVTRLRRGDVDKVAVYEDILQLGDRIRVISPSDKMAAVSRFLGDSARGNSELNPLALTGGMAVGALIGLTVIPGLGLSLGVAAGCLLVGLVFGRVGRVGPVVLNMPASASQALMDLGLLLFLVQAGSTAGAQIGTAFSGDGWLRILVLGAFITTTMVVTTYFFARRFFGTGGTKTAGMLSAAQTQPALLAFVNQATGNDARVALGYSVIYPAAMIAKILMCQLLGSLG